ASAEVQKFFPLQNLSVANDLLSTHCQPHKQGDNHAHKQVRWNIQVFAEQVLSLALRCHVVVLDDKRKNECEKRCLQQVDDHVLPIVELRLHIAHSEQQYLFDSARNTKGRMGYACDFSYGRRAVK